QGERAYGFFIYNATLHVPLIVHMPEAHAPASRSGGSEKVTEPVADPVNLADLVPTVLEIVKLDAPSGVQGRSLVPLVVVKGKTGSASLYAETFLPRLHFNWSELRGVETENYHFIDAPKPELYDLAKDPGETQNLYADKKAVSEEMRARLAALIHKYGTSQELAQKTGLDPALMERLKSLGYAGFSGGGG